MTARGPHKPKRKAGKLNRTFSIITVSKSRLEHLKLSLPQMLQQQCAEVIVVDYSCPLRTREYVARQFPSVRLVSVEGEKYFSNWAARNAGASVATADVLVFCDADTILANNAVEWLADNLPDDAFGFFGAATTPHSIDDQPLHTRNQLRGFHAVPSRAFRQIGGYDEVLRGYAAGGDTDMMKRLELSGLAGYVLPPGIIQSIIVHDDADRMQHHADPVRTSYCAGLLYRAAKFALLRLRNTVELPLRSRRSLYEAARRAAIVLGSPDDSVGMVLDVDIERIGMPRLLGYAKGTQRLSLKVVVSLQDRLE
jgi:glycosyltransferase involved in cell wall biosynthesis